jgi:hypothetical protein
LRSYRLPRTVITSRLVRRSCCGFSIAERLACKKVYALDAKIFCQLYYSWRAFIAIEALDDLTVREPYTFTQLVKLGLRQSTADSGHPEIDITARAQ